VEEESHQSKLDAWFAVGCLSVPGTVAVRVAAFRSRDLDIMGEDHKQVSRRMGLEGRDSGVLHGGC